MTAPASDPELFRIPLEPRHWDKSPWEYKAFEADPLATWDHMNTRGGVHETAGVLRMHRSGMTGPAICKALGLQPKELIRLIKQALDDESDAAQAGQVVYDAAIKKGTV